MNNEGIRRYLVGHRGAGSVLAPGSTMASLQKAAELGLEWVEFDVRLTADGHLVIANADDLYECSGQDIKISQATLDDLANVDVAHSFVGANTVHHIPLFEDAIRFCKANGIRTQIELKGVEGTEKSLAEAVVGVLERPDLVFPAGQEPLITSFSPVCLKAIDDFSTKPLDKGLLIHTHKAAGWEELAMEANPTYVHFYGGLMNGGDRLTQKFGTAVRAAGYQLNGFKINTWDDAEVAIAAGVQRFTSDRPEIFLE